MLIVKYERKDFFGHYQYTEDSKENYDRADVKKAVGFTVHSLIFYLGALCHMMF